MEELRREVIKIQNKVKDLLDEPNAFAAKRLQTEIQGLEDDLQMKKNARTIEERVRRMLQLLEGDARDARIMDHDHLDQVIGWFEDIRDDLRKL